MSKQLVLDIVERVFWTFVQAFLAVFVVSDVSSARSAAVAGAAAALSAIKGIVASRIGDKGTAALLPSSSPASDG